MKENKKRKIKKFGKSHCYVPFRELEVGDFFVFKNSLYTKISNTQCLLRENIFNCPIEMTISGDVLVQWAGVSKKYKMYSYN